MGSSSCLQASSLSSCIAADMRTLQQRACIMSVSNVAPCPRVAMLSTLRSDIFSRERRNGGKAVSNALQLELGGDWRRGRWVVARSALNLAVGKDYCEFIDPGLLARVSKVYRPVVILPGLGNNSSDYNVLVKSVEALEVPASVVKVTRLDWLRNAAGILDGNYWKGVLRPRPVLDWYLDRIKVAIETAKGGSEEGKVSLIGHSAGGWLARVYMAEFGVKDISLLITLGTPHLPPPRGVPGVFDQTRGLLYYVEENCPGAYHAPNVKYVCVASRYIKGIGRVKVLDEKDKTPPIVTSGAGALNLSAPSLNGNNSIGEDLKESISGNDKTQAESFVDEVVETQAQENVVKVPRATFRERIIGQGYKQVCGKADVWGDGVVPEESAYLEGATNIKLDGVYHSPVGANDLERPWYGSAGKFDQWACYLLE